MNIKRWLAGIGITLFFLIVICIIGLSSPTGLKMGLRLAEKLLPGELHYERINGALKGPIDIKNFSYQNKKLSIHITNLHLQWQPSYLIIGELRIKNIHAEHIQIKIEENSQLNPAISWSSLTPFAKLVIHYGKFEDITVEEPKQFLWHFNYLQIRQLFLNHHLRADITTHVTRPYPITVEFKLAGMLQGYHYQLLTHSRDFNWKLHGVGTDQWIALNIPKSHTLDGSISAHAKITFGNPLRWDAKINAQHLNLSHLNKNWSKQLNLNLNTSGFYQNQIPLFIVDFDMHTPSALIQIKGTHEGRWNLNWKIAINQFNSLFSNAAGTLNGSGNIVGPTETPIIQGKINGRNLLYQHYRAKQINASWLFDRSFHTQSNIQIQANELETNKMQITSLTIDGNGKPNKHELKINATINNNNVGETSFNFDLQGRYINATWTGLLSQLTLKSNRFGTWHLTSKPTLSVSENSASTPAFCLMKGIGKICVHGNWNSKKPWHASILGTNVPPEPFMAILKDDLLIHSLSTIQVNLSGIGKNITTTQFNFDFKQGHILLPGLIGSGSTRFEHATIKGQIGQEQASVDASLILSRKNMITGKLSIRKNNETDSKSLDGKFTINSSDINFVHALIPEIIKPTGRLIAIINLSGTTTHPNANGRIELQNGSVYIPNLKITLNQMMAEVNAEKGYVTYRIDAYSEKQLIQITGKTKLASPDYPTELHIRGDDVLVMNTAEYTIYASPTLDTTIIGHKVTMQGTVTIPSALIQTTSFKTAVSLPEDTTFIGPSAQTESPWQLFMDVTIIAGKQVKVNSHGVKGNLAGQIHIVHTPTQSSIATGQISIVNGTFSTHKHTLILEPGSMIQYSKSPLLNPNLNIRASRHLKVQTTTGIQVAGLTTITVGVDIQGTLHHPNVSLYSIPSNLSQADILSYLIFGHPSNANTPDNVTQLIQAVDNLNISSGKYAPGGAIDQIAQGLGLSEFGIEQENSLDTVGAPLGREDTAFVVGRYIAPRIYVRYSRGLVIPLNIVEIRYLIGNNWAVQTESSSLGNGIDILYTVQRP